jgi:hypothetical protein
MAFSPAETTQTVHVILRDMKEQLSLQDAAALQKDAAKLTQSASPATVMAVLAPRLFIGDESSSSSSAGQSLTAADALVLLGFLAKTNPSMYLREAAHAIRDEAVRLTHSADPMIVSPALRQAMVDQLASSNVQAASDATDAVVACCRKLGLSFAEPALLAVAQHWQVALQRLSTEKASASTLAIRCASAVLEMVSLDEKLLEIGVDHGVLQLLLNMLVDDQDALLQMSVLDLMERTARVRPMHHALGSWLFSQPVLAPLLQLSGGSEEEEDEEADPILGGPALRVLAALCKISQAGSQLVFPTETVLLTGFHRALHNMEGATGELDRLARMDAISSFAGASADALALVLQDPVTRDGWLSLNVSQPKLKAAILVSVARVLDPLTEHVEGGSLRHAPADLLKLYALLGRTNRQESTSMLLTLARSPLPEIRFSVYALLQAVTKLSTGGQVLLSTAGFVDFLLSREGETTKEGREGRYALVEAIHASPVKGLLAEGIVNKLEAYVSQGPHYVKSMTWELAVE